MLYNSSSGCSCESPVSPSDSSPYVAVDSVWFLHSSSLLWLLACVLATWSAVDRTMKVTRRPDLVNRAPLVHFDRADPALSSNGLLSIDFSLLETLLVADLTTAFDERKQA